MKTDDRRRRAEDGRNAASSFFRHQTSVLRTRTETDPFCPTEVPPNDDGGAQTERSRHNFAIGEQRIPRPLIAALALAKRGAAETNRALGLLDARRAKAIVQAAQEILDGKLDEHFSLSVYQTGSGTPDQHERQRGDCQSRQRDPRRRARRQIADPSQRSRQYEPVVE